MDMVSGIIYIFKSEVHETWGGPKQTTFLFLKKIFLKNESITKVYLCRPTLNAKTI